MVYHKESRTPQCLYNLHGVFCGLVLMAYIASLGMNEDVMYKKL